MIFLNVLSLQKETSIDEIYPPDILKILQVCTENNKQFQMPGIKQQNKKKTHNDLQIMK